MKAMTWEEIDRDWGGLQKKHRMEIAQSVARYCIGHSMEEVAKRLGYSRQWCQTQLDYAGVAAALGGANAFAPLTGATDNVAKEIPRVLREYSPSEEEQKSKAFAPYLEHYQEQGHNETAALRLAKAEWAAESAVEAGVIKEDTKKSGERVNRILFPDDPVDTWELRFRGHMAAIERAAEFLDSPETKISYLRRKSTRERVSSAHTKWLEQVERVRNLHPQTFSKET